MFNKHWKTDENTRPNKINNIAFVRHFSLNIHIHDVNAIYIKLHLHFKIYQEIIALTIN
jgi:hypothetical protein